ncbi:MULTISPECIES: hypothetical protein [unclassified Sphingomonas]|uniref:hypothetical protein n=1 Tax=unclassified Sphingomonas TaxID=196159 RepID=UPI001F568FF7|nr:MULTISPECIES: hypothetical protein [unclassified Sphingomonas]
MDTYLQALDLMLRASDLMEQRGETALVAHMAMPIALLSERVRGASGYPQPA